MESDETQSKTPSWQAAELLEEILNEASPVSVFKRSSLILVGNARSGPVSTRFATDLDKGVVTAHYWLPVVTVMRNVLGTPEEVLELLRTGLKPGQDAALTGPDPSGHRAFVLQQTYNNARLAQRVGQMIQDEYAELKKVAIGADTNAQ